MWRYTIFCLFICLWTCGLFPLWGYYEQCYKHLFASFCVDMFSVLLSTYLEVELMGHMVILCLIFLGNTTPFSTTTGPFYIPSNNAQDFQFLSVLTNTCFFFPLFFFLVEIRYFAGFQNRLYCSDCLFSRGPLKAILSSSRKVYIP